jgi:predicted transcriptional regulator
MIRQDRNSQLIRTIEKNPGIKFREIMRDTGMKNGVLSYHIAKLEKDGSIQVQRGARQTRFYPLHITEEESKVIKALRRQTPRDIISALILDESLEFNEIVSHAGKSQSTVSLYLSQLVSDGIVQVQFYEKKRRYKLKDRLVVDKLIEDYHPGLLEKPTAGFEDIINSL